MRVPRIGPPFGGLLLVVGLLAPGGPATPSVLAVSPPQFVQATGTSLTLGGFPFKLRGAAIYGTSNPGGPASASQVLDWAAVAHLNTIRLVNMFDESGLDDLAPYDETNWAHVDELLDDISARGMHALLDLSAFRNHLVNRDIRANDLQATCQPDVPRPPGTYDLIDPYRVGLASEWQTFIDFVTSRVNTVNGVAYKDDPTIAVISLAGEPQPPGSEECGKATSGPELTEFYRRTLEMLHDDDANHVRSSGGLIHLDWQQLYGHSSGIDGEAIFALADNTLPALHTYPPAYAGDGTPIDYQSPALGPYATGLGKPWFTEEFGWTQNVGDATRASRYGWLYEEQYTYGSSGALFWNLGPEVAGGSHDANPSTPITWSVIVAAAGGLDPTFGASGTGKVVTSTGPGNDMIQGIVLQPDGKIVVAGGSADVAVARYNRNGSPDSSFGTGGVVVTDFGSNSDAGRAVALQPDGKIVVAATQGCCGGVSIALARYDADGTLDPTFGTGGTTTLAGPGVENYAQAIAVQPDGKILVGGSQDFSPLVVRLNEDGSFDSTFGSGGAAVQFPADQGQSMGLAVLPGGTILAGGYRYSGCCSHSDFEIVRLNPDGSVDTTFGPALDGKVIADLNGNSDDVAFGLAVEGDGRIVLAGSSQKTFQPYDFAVARFTAGGSLDATFGTAGVVNTNLGADEQGRAIAITPDQRIIVAGQSTGNQQSDFAIVAYTANGSLDTNFGTGGVVKTDFQSSDDKAFAVAVQPDGKILTGGYTIAGSYKFAVARYFGGEASTTPPATSPDAPTGVTAAAGDGQAAVSWTAPASDGGSAITGYTVTAAPGGATQPAAAGSTSATISGLSNGTPYTFTITATNAIGAGPASDPSDPVTPQAGAPPPQTATETVPPAGGTATTGSSATPADPIATSVTLPPTTAGGTLTIAETAVGETPPAGYAFLGQQIDITSSSTETSASNPLTIVFTIDASLLLAATGMAAPPPDSVDVTRAESGTPVIVPACTTTGPPIAPNPCVSDRQYVGDDLRITILTGSASHWNTAVKPVAVTVTNSGYSPKTVTLAQGGIVLWTFAGSKPHSVTENLKLGPAKAPLFTSGVLTRGRYGTVLRAAATYAYGSTVKGDPGGFTGSVAVPVRITPTSGGPTTSFTVTWSSSTLSGYAFDVQYRFMKAGGKSWSALKAWKTGVSTTTAAFSPTSGAGTYAFSARLRNTSTGMASLWSPETTIVVH